MIVRFHIVAPLSKKRSFSVRLPILLGRGEDAKFRIQHDLVSRRHCEFFAAEGTVFVRDLGSTNGTFLNDEQVPASVKTPVPHAALVRVGGLSFRVEYAQAGAAAAATEDPKVSGGGGIDNPRTVAVDLRQFAPQVAATAGVEPEVSIEQSQEDDLPLPDFTEQPAAGSTPSEAAPGNAGTPVDPSVADFFAPAVPAAVHDAEQPSAPPLSAAPPALDRAGGDFGFLDSAGGSPADSAQPAAAPVWPSAEGGGLQEPGDAAQNDSIQDPAIQDQAIQDDALDNFFKGLK